MFTIALRMIDLRGLRDIRRESPGEFRLALLTAAAVVGVGVELGILLAIGLSLLRHVHHSYRPHTGVLVRDAAGEWQVVPCSPGVLTEPGLLVYRFGADLFYANERRFVDEVRGLVGRRRRRRCARWWSTPRPMSDLDYSAARSRCAADRRTAAAPHRAGLRPRLAGACCADMQRHGIAAALGAQHLHGTLHEALADARRSPTMTAPTAEDQRLAEARERGVPWRRWGPYVSERQWGTVREDYSARRRRLGTTCSHDQARSRAYRWGEDGIAGISDDAQRLCFALTLWNGADPILKERLFGLTGHEGNHGEDVKEYYFYLDNLPSHAYMKYLYKYPQQAFPYAQLLRGEPAPRPRRSPSTSCSTPASSTTTATSMSSSNTPRPGPTTCWCASAPSTAGPRPRRCICCPRCGSATTGRGRRASARPLHRADASRPRRAGSRRIRSMEPFWLHFEPARGRAVHREREQRARGCGASRRRLRQGRLSTTSSSAAAPTR